ncbi:hypothetical protein LZ30DRAFT_240934 [Colletotrichum cereale]|nr:hypothetical protein LZ30DRAFT_240934 [Colletotrichum cereale]
MVHPHVFFVSGVSLPVPPWPENPILSAAVLLHPGNVKRFGRSLESKNLQDRQRRVYINLVVLFQLSTRCHHLAFDRDAFWDFVSHHWAVPNAGPQKAAELVDIYSERRRVYLESAHIKRKHYDLLTDLIDAWNSCDHSPSPPYHLSRPEIDAEWDRVETSWLEQLRLDNQSLLDESNRPHIGNFPARKGAPSAFKIKGGSSRPTGYGKDLFERITEPSPDRRRGSPATTDSHTTESPPPKAVRGAIDDLIQTGSRKRRFTPDTPSVAKRQCIPESLPSCPQLEHDATSAPQKAARQGQGRDCPQGTPLYSNSGPADEANQLDLEAQQAEQSLTHSDPTASSIGNHVEINNSALLESLGRRIAESDKEIQMLKEQTKLLLESREFSRDIQKAHDQLIIFTASKCQEALGRLEQLGSQVDILGKDAVASRQSDEELQKRQTKQQCLTHGLRGHVAIAESGLDGLEESEKGLIAHENRRNHGEEHRQAIEARLAQLESKLESLTSVRLQTTESAEAELRTIEKGRSGGSKPVMPDCLDERRETTETNASNHQLKAEVEGRLTKLEETIATSTTLINNCRTLVEVSKTTADQHLSILDNRVKLLENRFSNHLADQVKISNEQAERLELVEAELAWYKEAKSNQLQQKFSRPSRSEFADLQGQLNAMKNSLAVFAQRQGANPAEEASGTPLSLLSQTALNRPARSGHNASSASSRKHASDTIAVKKEN